jgi:hypothetical protein
MVYRIDRVIEHKALAGVRGRLAGDGQKKEEAWPLLLVLRTDPCQRAFFGARARTSPLRGLLSTRREELAYRQDLRDLERLVTWEGFIRRKQRKTFERYFTHSDPRIRKYAQELQGEDREMRATTESDE